MIITGETQVQIGIAKGHFLSLGGLDKDPSNTFRANVARQPNGDKSIAFLSVNRLKIRPPPAIPLAREEWFYPHFHGHELIGHPLLLRHQAPSLTGIVPAFCSM